MFGRDFQEMRKNGHFEHGGRSDGRLDELVEAFFALVYVVWTEIVQETFAWKLGIEERIQLLDLKPARPLNSYLFHLVAM